MRVNNIRLNLLDKYYMFYDWLDNDDIQIKNHLPVYKVSSQTIEDFINYKIKLIDLNITNSKIKIFTDEFKYIAIKFDNTGNSMLKSSLALDDEFRISKQLENENITKIIYSKCENEVFNNELRINKIIRNTIQKELETLNNSCDTDKISYIYYMWFKKNPSSKEKMINNMEKRIKMPISSQEIEIYLLIKNHYKVV